MTAMPLSIGLIHFVGIGGIGMSGIAEILHNLKYQVQGSDIAEGVNVKRLATLGIKQSDLTRIPEQALQDNAHKTNPRSLTAADYSHLIEQVFE